MKKYRCGKCGMTFEGKLENCPGCGVQLHYVDSEIRLQSENAIKENSVSTFRFDDDDVIKTGVPESEADLPSVQEQFFESKQREKEFVSKSPSSSNSSSNKRVETRRVSNDRLISSDTSYYDGRKIVEVLLKIGLFFLSLITIFIAIPWAVTIYYRWDAKHTVLCGHRLTFDGTGGQLFGRYILWFFLTIITAGIFSFWLTHYLKKWKIKHTLVLKNEE